MAEQDGGFPALRAVLAAELANGPDCGVQLSIGHAGGCHELVAGEDGRGAAMTAATIVPWTCSSKPLGAIAFARAWDAGRLSPDDLVADHLPEYAAGGKDTVRLRDLLTHTTGVSDPIVNLDTQGAELPPWDEIDPMIWLVICAAEREHPAGRAMSYNPIANWFTLDRVLTGLDGAQPSAKSGDSYRSTFTDLGLSASLGLPTGAGGSAAGRAQVVAGPDEADNLRRLLVAAELPLPGTGVWGTMADLRAVGQALLSGTAADGSPLARPATLEAMTATHWPGTSRRVLSTSDFPYGMGFMTLPQLYGRDCSFRTYGHAGGNNSTLLVDPVAGLVLAMYWNRRLSDVGAVTRRLALVRAAYRDLGLVTAGRPSRG